MNVSRRTMLRYAGVGTAAGLAGCLFGGDEGGSDTDDGAGSPDNEIGSMLVNADEFTLAGDGTHPYTGWLVPDAAIPAGNGLEQVFQYDDYETAGGDIRQLRNARQQRSTTMGVDAETISGELLVGVPDENRQFGSIILGSFDKDAVVTGYENETELEVTGEYRGYTTLGSQLVVGPDAVLENTAHERHIDAIHGDLDRLVNVENDVATVVGLLPAGIQTAVTRNENSELFSVVGSSIQEADDSGAVSRGTRFIEVYVFTDEESASLDRLREQLTSENAEIVTEELQGRVAMVEYTR
jgi:hypothetical protein